MLRIRFSTLAWAGMFLTVVSSCKGANLQEDFSTSPTAHGWQSLGNTNLFHWNAAGQNLEVTWDSSQPNSYFCHWLGATLGKDDDFSFEFDLRLSGFAAGVSPQKANPFQLSVGLLNRTDALRTNFLRGTGADSPDLAEFSFFPDPGGAWQWGPSLTAVMIDWTGTNWSMDGFAPLTLTTNDLFHVAMTYVAAERALHTILTRNGQAFGPIPDATLGSAFRDFHLDTIAVCSYSDAGQDPDYAGSIFAQGTIDNFAATVPLPVSELTGQFTNSVWETRFLSRTNWLYTLERTIDLRSWTAISGRVNGTGTSLVLPDTNSPPGGGFYRVLAERR